PHLKLLRHPLLQGYAATHRHKDGRRSFAARATMINGKRICVVLPAYNAEQTLEQTVHELPDLVDIRILVDDYSTDRTLQVAQRLGLRTFVHDRNYGYG